MSMSVEFTFPSFFSYPPYFTLQPNQESQAKQIELWKQLLLRYSKAKRRYKYFLKEDTCQPFHNPTIQLCTSYKPEVLRVTSQGGSCREVHGSVGQSGCLGREISICQLCSGGKTLGSLSLEGRQAVCLALVEQGTAEWVGKDHTECLVTIHPVPQWASTLHTIVRTRFTSSIVTIEELHSGEDAQGTEIEGLPEELILRALQVLEKEGRVTLFSTDKGTGVKFA